MDEPTIIFRVHAVEQMFRRGISEVDVRSVLEDGETIEEYPDDLPYPARLVLGWVRVGSVRMPIHVVVSFDAERNTMYIVTVYGPNPDLWERDFQRRKS